MTSLPDRTRPRLTQPVKRAGASALRLAGAAVWRALHPSLRGAFLEGRRPERLPRIHVESDDGWSVPLFRFPVRPGAAGEPVLLLHTAACGAEMLRFGSHSLAHALADAGYAVFLAAQRGDREAVGPTRSTARLHDVVRRDLPAMLARLRADTGARRVHVAGFGLGALLAIDLGARCPDEVASVIALAPPLRFPSWRTEARRLHLAARLLPPSWALPLRTMARVGAPLVGEAAAGTGARLRGAMAYGGADVPVAIAVELARWVAEGRVELEPGRELEVAAARGRAPLLVVRGDQDVVCETVSVAAVQRCWGGPVHDRTVPGYGHVELVLAEQAPVDVFAPSVAWLRGHGSGVWGDVEDIA